MSKLGEEYHSDLHVLCSVYYYINIDKQGRREAERALGQYFDTGPFGIFCSTVYF